PSYFASVSSISGVCTSGSPATLVATEITPERRDADKTIIQFTSCKTAAVPIVATNVCAIVLTALTPAAFAHEIQYSLFFKIIPPIESQSALKIFVEKLFIHIMCLFV